MSKKVNSLVCRFMFGAGLLMAANVQSAEYDKALLDAHLQRAMSSIVFDPALLKQPVTTDWMANVNFSSVSAIFGDVPIDPAQAARAAERFTLQDKSNDLSIRINPDKGALRYVNRNRAWDYDTNASTPAVSDADATKIASGALRGLGLPTNEIGSMKVFTQMARAGGANTAMKEVEWPMARLVAIDRTIPVTFANKVTYKIPVLGSSFLAAVVNKGSSTAPNPLVQRALVKWPAFKMNTLLKMRPAANVRSQALTAILAEKLSDDDKKLGEISRIEAFVAYSNVYERPTGIDTADAENKLEGPSKFVPVTVFNVYPPEGSTSPPMQLAIPMAL